MASQSARVGFTSPRQTVAFATAWWAMAGVWWWALLLVPSPWELLVAASAFLVAFAALFSSAAGQAQPPEVALSGEASYDKSEISQIIGSSNSLCTVKLELLAAKNLIAANLILMRLSRAPSKSVLAPWFLGQETHSGEKKLNSVDTLPVQIFETVQQAHNVPFGSCFEMHCRWSLETVSPSSCMLDIRVGTHFKKLCIKQAKIRSGGFEEYKKDIRDMLESARQYLHKVNAADQNRGTP